MNDQTQNAPVDVLPALSPEHLRILQSFAEDTGGFRMNNAQATDLAAACAAAVRLVAVAEAAIVALSAAGAPTRTEREEIIASLRAGGAK
jgi:hypothetical protein